MEKPSVSDLVNQVRQTVRDIKRYTSSRRDLTDLITELGNLRAAANKYIPLSIAVEELLSRQQESQQIRRLSVFWDFFLRDEKTKSETDKQHRRNIEIRKSLRKAGFYTALFIGISFTVEGFKVFDNNDIREICTLAREYMETYSLKDCFLRVGFYKVTQKLVGQVSEWKSDITQFICDALEKHAGTSKNKDSANDDHPTSKRSRSEGAIDGTASPLQKRAKTVADSHTEVPTAANTGRCLQEHQTPNIGPLTSSPSVTQDRVLRTPFSGTFVRFIDAQAGLNILRAEPDLCDQRTILTLAENYSCLTLHPAPGSNRNIFQDRIAELAKDVSQDWPLGVPRDTDVYRVKRDEGLHHVGTEWCKIKDRARLLVYKNGSTFLTFFLNDEKVMLCYVMLCIFFVRGAVGPESPLLEHRTC